MDLKGIVLPEMTGKRRGNIVFKILVVDDEKGHRCALTKMLYAIYPDDMFLEAESGEQALEVLQLMECDIVITDIRMGGMNGLELLKNIRNEFGNIAVIILSGYGEFEYAREALTYGASDYLLKPVDTEEVQNCLNKVRKNVEERKAVLETHTNMQFQLQETEIIYIEYLMRQFVSDPGFEKKDKIREIFPIEQPGYFFFCDIKTQKKNKKSEIDEKEVRMALKQALPDVSSYSFEIAQKNVFAVLVLAKKKGERSFFEKVRRDLQKNLPLYNFSFYVGSLHQNMYEETPNAYQEADQMWQYRFYELGDYCDYDLLKERLNGKVLPTGNLTLVLTEKMKQNDIMGAFQAVKEYIEKNTEMQLPVPSQLCRSIMLLIFQLVKELDTMLSDDLKKKTDEALQEIHQSDNISMLLRKVYSYLLELGKDVHFQKETKGTDVLEHCRVYLEGHYMNEITLEQIAEKYYFNASYFSTLFKNYFGKSFLNYLTELRMRKAKEILIESDNKVKIKDVANRVGYHDANYFIRAFKKFYGYTPEEYRKIRAQDKI